MTKQSKWLVYGLVGAAAFWLWKKKQDAAGSIAAPMAANLTVSPTAAATTANMQPLTGLGLASNRMFYQSRGLGVPRGVASQAY